MSFKPGDTVWIVPENYLRVGILERELVSFNEKVALVTGKRDAEYHADSVFPSKSLAVREAQRRRDLEISRLMSRIANLRRIDFYEH